MAILSLTVEATDEPAAGALAAALRTNAYAAEARRTGSGWAVEVQRPATPANLAVVVGHVELVALQHAGAVTRWRWLPEDVEALPAPGTPLGAGELPADPDADHLPAAVADRADGLRIEARGRDDNQRVSAPITPAALAAALADGRRRREHGEPGP